MAAKTFWDLVKLSLPEDVHPRELLSLSPQKWWEEKPYLAAAHALRKSPRINWDAYLARYDDVRQSGMDPCLHYLKHGIFESRKLISWHKLKEPEKPGCPLVSIVIINYNNAHLLEKSIGSVVNQTLRDIEIIIVDDCSTDESLDIIRSFATHDKRIRVLVNPENSLTLIARKRGVEAATGRYLMFLDSDDFLAPNACEVAAKEIEKGYDAVRFGLNIVSFQNAPQREIEDCEDFFNKGLDKEYFYDECTTAIFRDRKINWNLWALIYVREISVAAFRELGEHRFTGPDDLLALLASLRHVRCMRKIPERLIFYNYGPGITVTTDKKKIYKYLDGICGTTRFIYDYALESCSVVEPGKLYTQLCEDVGRRFLPIANEQDAPAHFKRLLDTLGFWPMLKTVLRWPSQEQSEMAALFQPLLSGKRDIHNIGIYYPARDRPELRRMVRAICSLLGAQGYKITVFVEGDPSEILDFSHSVEIIQVAEQGNDSSSFLDRLESLRDALERTQIDVLIHAASYLPCSLWDTVLLHHFNIPVIFLYPQKKLPAYEERNLSSLPGAHAALRNADLVIFQTAPEEIYWRMRGVNAVHLDPPLSAPFEDAKRDISHKIAVLADYLESMDEFDQCLLVLRDARRLAPWLSMTIIGEFNSPELRQGFLHKLRDFDLAGHVAFAGENEEQNKHLNASGVLLSVAKNGPHAVEIALARLHGLPCVAYRGYTYGSDEPGVLGTNYGNHGASGKSIATLLQDEDRWRELSQLAMDKRRLYDQKLFVAKLQELLANMLCYTPVQQRGVAECAAIS